MVEVDDIRHFVKPVNNHLECSCGEESCPARGIVSIYLEKTKGEALLLPATRAMKEAGPTVCPVCKNLTKPWPGRPSTFKRWMCDGSYAHYFQWRAERIARNYGF